VDGDRCSGGREGRALDQPRVMLGVTVAYSDHVCLIMQGRGGG
jgi:hypothetical protein